MSGTRAGGLRAAKKIRKNFGKNFYQEIGRIGGSKTYGMKGFALDHQRAVSAGARGGSISRRGPQYPMAFIKKTVRRYRRTGNVDAIAEAMGVSRSTVLRWSKIYSN